MKIRVAKVIADDFQRHPFLEQPLCTGVAEDVRAWPLYLDADLFEVFHDVACQGESAQERLKWSDYRQENLAMGARWTPNPQVIDDGVFHGGRQGIRRAVAGFARADMQRSVPPVDVIQTQT